MNKFQDCTDCGVPVEVKRFGKVRLCAECYREREREHKAKWYAENADKRREYCAKWRAENADKQHEYKEKYRAENADKLREYSVKYRAENADKLRENKAQYRAKIAQTETMQQINQLEKLYEKLTE